MKFEPFPNSKNFQTAISLWLKWIHFSLIVQNEKSAGNQCFLLFQQYFLPIPKQILILGVTVILSSANVFSGQLLIFSSTGKKPAELMSWHGFHLTSVHTYEPDIVGLGLVYI